MPPLISVVLNSYVRVKYLWEALDSILRQESVGRFEVILLSAVDGLRVPQELDQRARAKEVTIRPVPVPPGPVGVGLMTASQEAEGEWLAILDDDDLWEAGKLRAVERALKADSGLTYFHNAQTFVDETNRPLPAYSVHRLVRHTESLISPGRTVVIESGDPRSIARGFRFFPEFNNSSIVIRRSLLSSMPEVLRRLRRAEDSFLFFSALATGGRLFHTTDRLTRYRLHSLSATHVAGTPDGGRAALKGYLEHVEAHLESLRLVRECLLPRSPPDVEEFVMADESYWQVMRAIVKGDGRGAGMRTTVGSLLGGTHHGTRTRDLLTALAGASAMVSPSLLQRALGRWRMIW